MASQEELDFLLKATADVSGAQQMQGALQQTQQVADETQAAIARSQAKNDTLLRQAMAGQSATLENYRNTVKQMQQAGFPPTLPPSAFGIAAGGGLPPPGGGPGGPSLAFATLQAAQQRQLAGGVDPVQARLEATRQAQAEQYAKINTALEREYNAEQKAASVAERNSQRLEAGLLRRAAAQGETSALTVADDPQAQARLYQARIAQQRQFDILLRERARTAARGGEAPTVGMPPEAINRLQEATLAQQQLGESAGVSVANIIRLGAAFTGFGIGLSLWTAAGRLANQAMQGLAGEFLTLDQVMRANTLTLGASASGYQQWAATVSEQAGVTQRSLLEAGTAAQQFGRTIGLAPEQIQGLTALAEILARIRGQDVGVVMNQLTAAMQGNVQAANALNLQLDAGYLAFTQLGGATEDVFSSLDPSTQAWLRYEAALGQAATQAATAAPDIDKLREAQGKLNVEWEKFSQAISPPVISALSGILGLANAILGLPDLGKPFQDIPQDIENYKNAVNGLEQQIRAAFGAAGEQIARQMAPVGEALGQRASELGTLAKQGNDALRDTTGFDAQATAATAAAAAGTLVADAYGGVTNAFNAAQAQATQMATRLSAVADQSDRAGASAQNLAEHNQRTADLAGLGGTLVAARQNEINANRALIDMKNAQLQITAQEAAVKLQMLPAQERMLELQNETAQAQIRAQQAAVGYSRVQQDLQNQIRLNTLIAQSADRPMEERQAALRTATALTRRTPETDIAALQAQIRATPAQRAAEDVQAQAQLQTLQAQATFFGPEFQKQQLDLLSQVATAAKAAAEKTVQLTIQGINVIVQGTGLAFTDTDYNNIVQLAGQAVADAIHTAVQTVEQRGVSSQLLGTS